jgi:hypothetical protein
MAISRDRADKIARSHSCIACREYSWRRILIREPAESLKQEFGEVWHAILVCGVCGLQQEIGIDDDGDILYVT